MIEADEKVFKKCEINRPNTDKYNVALCDRDGEIEFMSITGYAQMLSGIVSEYNEEHLKRIYKEVEETNGKIEIIKMQGAKFDTIMQNYKDVDTIDYLSIDVEGGEMKILQSINFDKYNITLIGIEDNYPQSSGIQEFLKDKGYKKLCDLGCDVFFEKQK